MKSHKVNFQVGMLLCAGLMSLYITSSCHNRVPDGMILFTRVPAAQAELLGGDVFHPYSGAQIAAIHPDKPGRTASILTADFHSACSPDLSYDAKHMLFLAQQTAQDTWQVWEMDLKDGTSRQITDFAESCAGPAYLPGGRLVFSRRMPNEGYGSTDALFTMNLDGTGLNRITFQPHADFPVTILRDGRILMFSKQVYPKTGPGMYLALRPNGTKTELFYAGPDNSTLGNQAYETPEGKVYFIEQDAGTDPKANLISIHQNRPLFTRVNHSCGLPGSFHSVFPLPSGELLVSYRSPEAAASGLFYFSPEDGTPGQPVLEDPDHHLLEPLLVEAYKRPRHLPDEVNKMESTGQLFCQNINVTALQQGPEDDPVTATLVEVLGLDQSMGVVTVEEDGSFYLKIIADTPFRLQTLDENRQVIHGPSGWLWLRPFERRGCVGCHEDPELVPKNFVPLAVKKRPVSIPIEGAQEPLLDSAE